MAQRWLLNICLCVKCGVGFGFMCVYGREHRAPSYISWNNTENVQIITNNNKYDKWWWRRIGTGDRRLCWAPWQPDTVSNTRQSGKCAADSCVHAGCVKKLSCSTPAQNKYGIVLRASFRVRNKSENRGEHYHSYTLLTFPGQCRCRMPNVCALKLWSDAFRLDLI